MAPIRVHVMPALVPTIFAILLGLCALAPNARGQTVEVAGTTGSAVGTGVRVAVLGMQDGDRTADVRFGVVRAAQPGGVAIVGARVARSATLGLLGAATLELETDWRTDGYGRARLVGQGVLGPASLQVGVLVAGADPEAFSMTGVAPTTDTPRVGGPAVVAQARVRYRASRDLLVGVEPDLAFAPDGLGLRLRGELRVRRLVEPFDGVVAVHAWRSPGDGTVSGALGLGAIWAPRRAPEWRTTLWIGWKDGVVAPGIAVQGASSLGGGFGLAVELAAEPFRADVPPYRGAVGLDAELGPHEAFAVAEWQAEGNGEPAVALALGIRLALPGG